MEGATPGNSHGDSAAGNAHGETGGSAGATESRPGTGGDGGKELFRQRYLSRLLAHIEFHKFYPPIARLRRLEGGAKIQFILGADGGISDLRVSSGEPLLEQAARQSVERAVPMPMPQNDGIVPLSVSYTMNFRLR